MDRSRTEDIEGRTAGTEDSESKMSARGRKLTFVFVLQRLERLNPLTLSSFDAFVHYL